MILAKEITKWEDVKYSCNHTYLMSDNMTTIYAYFKWHKPNEFQMLKNPMKIDKRYRQFKILQRGYEFDEAQRESE